MDIHDRQQAQLLIQQKQKWESIGLVAGGIAHDFNNLLVGIVGGASLVSEILPSTDASQSTLRTIIIESGERAATLTRQLLAYSGKGQYFVERLQLPAIAPNTCERIKISVSDSVQVSIETAEPLPLIEADASQRKPFQEHFLPSCIHGTGPL